MANHINDAGKAMAELYVWDAIVAILEGATRPIIGSDAADKIIKTAKKQQGLCLNAYDVAEAKALQEEKE